MTFKPPVLHIPHKFVGDGKPHQPDVKGAVQELVQGDNVTAYELQQVLEKVLKQQTDPNKQNWQELERWVNTVLVPSSGGGGGFPSSAIGYTEFSSTGTLYDQNTLADQTSPFLFGHQYVSYLTQSTAVGAPSLVIGGSGGLNPLGTLLICSPGLDHNPLLSVEVSWFYRQYDGTLDGGATEFDVPQAGGFYGAWGGLTDQRGAGNAQSVRGIAGTFAWTGRWPITGGATGLRTYCDGTAGGHWAFAAGGLWGTRIRVTRWD